jgi:hypothetical protein
MLLVPNLPTDYMFQMQSISSMEEEDGRNGEETCTVCQPVDFDFPQIIKSPQNQQRINTNQLFWL